ncbi:hypothetical protein ACC696_38650, partial [Rhizobium ruizarguesonis]
MTEVLNHHGKIVADPAGLWHDQHIGGNEGSQLLPVVAFRQGRAGIDGQHPQTFVGDIGNAA